MAHGSRGHHRSTARGISSRASPPRMGPLLAPGPCPLLCMSGSVGLLGLSEAGLLTPSICPRHGSHRESPKPPECPRGPQAQTTSGRVGLGPGEARRGPHSRSSFRGHSGCSSPHLLREGPNCVTPASTSQRRGRSWVLGLPGKDPARPQQKAQSLPAAVAGRDRWSQDPGLPSPSLHLLLACASLWARAVLPSTDLITCLLSCVQTSWLLRGSWDGHRNVDG